MRIAAFNVENLFARPKAFDVATWAEGDPILSAFAEANRLIAHQTYTAADKARLIELLTTLEIYVMRDGVPRRNHTRDPRWAWLRANRGSFDVDRAATGMEIVARGRDAWIGWLELAVEPTDEISTRMTAKVIGDLQADILCVVEAEDRPALDRFNHDLLDGQYGHAMLIDGNDKRGIDVGILTTADIDITDMRSNVDVPDPVTDDHLFSRDCPEYRCVLPNGESVWVLVNHFKSQSGGGVAKRTRQADGVREIVDRLIADGEENIVVLGDLNEGPKADREHPVSMEALFAPDGPLVSAYELDTFTQGERPGTFQTCSRRNRLDYILVSRPLANRVRSGGIWRWGLWGNPTTKKRPDWPIYDEITESRHAASDHAAVYLDLD
ncbi:MAG: endonuclease/exonuclease/phosphatase family protein, partial [Thermoleophilia bacterium]